MKKPYGCHEAEPDGLLTVRAIIPHLCEAAYGKGASNETACMRCASGCAYGKRLLDLLGLERKAHRERDMIKALMMTPSARPTLRHRTGERGNRMCTE